MNPHELVNDVKEIKTMLVDLKKRKEPATAEQLRTITDRPIIIDAKTFAAYVSDALVDALKEKLPSTEAIKAAADTAATTIQESGTRTAGQIEKAARQQADVLASRIGFTSWRSAMVVFIGFLFVVIVAILTGQLWAANAVSAKAETEAVRAFTDWAKEQPEGKRLYKRYYNR